MSLIRSSGISRPLRVNTPDRTIRRSDVTTKCVVRHVSQRQTVARIQAMNASTHNHFRTLPTSPSTANTRNARTITPSPAAPTSTKYHQCGLKSTAISSPGFSRCRG
jgi:hypothetical protein